MKNNIKVVVECTYRYPMSEDLKLTITDTISRHLVAYGMTDLYVTLAAKVDTDTIE